MPWKFSVHRERDLQLFFCLANRRNGIADGVAGGQVERQVHRRELAFMRDGQCCGPLLEVRKGRDGHLRAVRAFDVDVVQLRGVFLVFRRDLEDDVVLVLLGEHGRNLALRKGVVQCVVDILRCDAEA